MTNKQGNAEALPEINVSEEVQTVPPPASGDAYNAETVVHSADEIKDMVAKIDRAAAGKKPSDKPPSSAKQNSSAPTSILSRDDLGIDVDMSPSKSDPPPFQEPTLASQGNGANEVDPSPELVGEPEAAAGGVNQGLLFVLVALAVAVGLGLALWR